MGLRSDGHEPSTFGSVGPESISGRTFENGFDFSVFRMIYLAFRVSTHSRLFWSFAIA